MATNQPPQPTPEQMAQLQAAFAAEAQRRGLTPQEFQAQQKAQLEKEAEAAGMTLEAYVNKLKAEAFAQHQARLKQMQEQAQAQQQAAAQQQGQAQQQHQHQHQHQQTQQVPIQNTGTPDPKAVALIKWLQTQNLKTRTCILNGQRKDMFKLKRALRAIESPEYAKAAAKANSQLPPVSPEWPSPRILQLLPLSLLALRVTKIDPHEGHGHGPSEKKDKKRVKGQWTVKIEQQQDIHPDLYYAVLYEGSQWRQRLYAIGALIGVMAVVLFPLWPLKMRIGVWYLSMGMLGLIGLFFAMAIVRLILFIITVFAVPPGLWLYPNLFEDVGFFDSFRPLWGWHMDEKALKEEKIRLRKEKREARARKAERTRKRAEAKAMGLQPGQQHAHPQQQQPQQQQAVPAPAPTESVPVEEGKKESQAATSGADAAQAEGSGLEKRKPMAAMVEEGDDE